MFIPSSIRLLCLSALIAGTLGCQSPPPVAADTPHGLIRAHDRAAGLAYRDDLLEFVDAIRELLPDTRDGAVELWVGELGAADGRVAETAWADAYTLTWEDGRTPRVYLPPASENESERRNLVAHELVHALLGESWHTLPTALEEGLATWVATQLEPRSYQRVTKLLAAGPDRLARLEISVSLEGRQLSIPDQRVTLAIASARDTSVESMLSYPHGDRLYPEDRGDKLRLYGVGLALVETLIERHGVDGLHALADRAHDEGLERVPTDWILEAAGAQDALGRNRALRPRLRPEDALWLLEHRGLWSHLRDVREQLLLRNDPRAASPELFVESLDVRFSTAPRESRSWRSLEVYEDLRDELLAVLTGTAD